MSSGARPGSCSTSGCTGEIGFEAASIAWSMRPSFERPAALAEVKRQRHPHLPARPGTWYGRHMIEALRGTWRPGRTGQPQAVPRHAAVRRDHARLLRPAPVRPLRGPMRAGGRALRAGLAAVVLLVAACEGVVPGRARRRSARRQRRRRPRRGHPGRRDHGDGGHHPWRVHHDLADRPRRSRPANFVALARCGFYEDDHFHRVLAGFVQAGDPNTRENQDDFEGWAPADPATVRDRSPARGLNYDPYTVAMANSGRPDSNGSQFFICLTDLDSQLPREYTIFDISRGPGGGRCHRPGGGDRRHRGPGRPRVIHSIEVLEAESTPS